MNLNARALVLVESLVNRAEEMRVVVHDVPEGGRVVDCGIDTPGGLLAGLELARICLAGLAEIQLVVGDVGGRPCPLVQVATDHPVRACLASQYAGWALSVKKFFAMGSGPMRAASGKEPLFAELGLGEDARNVVGVLEGRKRPTAEVVAKVASDCRVDPDHVTLLIAPTASLAGGVQIVARSVETALHKLHELKFDLSRILSACGWAPVPPVAATDMDAIGRTNDAILYGARVVLHVTGDDASLAEVGPKVPSSASADYGDPFATVFARYSHDFYAVDPLLFSPAEVVFQNVESGRVQAFGHVDTEVLLSSFYGLDRPGG